MYFGKISMKTVNIKEGSYRKWQVLIFPEFSLIQKYSLPSFWIIKVCLRRKDWGWGRGRNSCSERELGAPKAKKGRRARNKAKAFPASGVGDSGKKPEVSHSKGVWVTCQDKVRAVGS